MPCVSGQGWIGSCFEHNIKLSDSALFCDVQSNSVEQCNIQRLFSASLQQSHNQPWI